MKKVALGFILGLLIIVGLNAWGEKPYDDKPLKTEIKELKTNIARQGKLAKEQTEAIKYLTAVLGEHNEVIINNTERVGTLERDTIKDIAVKK